MAGIVKLKGLEKLSLLLTNEDRKFKLIIDERVEQEFLFPSINSSKRNGKLLTNKQKKALKCLFCDFLADCLGLTISEVDQRYGRPLDYGDIAIEGDEEFQPVHYALCTDSLDGTVRKYGDFARLHGYYNRDGYFVVKRFDWCHTYHNTPKKKGKCS